MPPSLPPTAPSANLPATSTWLFLSIVLLTMLIVGRVMLPAAALASQPAPARRGPAPRHMAAGRPALPHAGAKPVVMSAAL